MPADLQCLGGGRDADNRQTLWFSFNRRPTDDELRFIHDCVRRAALLSEPAARPQLHIVKQGDD